MPAYEQVSPQVTEDRPSPIRPVIVIGSLMIDLRKGCANLGNMPLGLSKMEFRLLVFLAKNAGRPVPRAELLRAVWHCNGPHGGTFDQVKGCIKRLRAKIEYEGQRPKYILTIFGYGYMIPSAFGLDQ